MVNLIVDKAALDKERDVVKNERRMRTENSPDGTMYEKIYELAFTKHPYHWPVIGYEADLDNASPEECLAFYKKHYAPNNATIVVVGDVDADEVKDLVERHYGQYQSQPLNHYNGPAEPKQTAPRASTLQLPLSVEKLFLAYRVPPQNHEDAAAVEILGNIIGHTQTSRLYKKLVDSGLASAVDAFYDSGKDDGLFIIIANMQKGKKAERAAQVVNQEIARMLSGGVTQAELKAALNRYKFDLYSTLESNFSKARHIGFLETVMGSTQAGADLLSKMERLNSTDINRVARKYFKPSQSTKIVGVPKGAQ
jgi:zinc protease